MTIHLYKNDLPDDVDLGAIVAIDTETTGLNFQRDRLCVVQISSGNGEAHLIHFKDDYSAPNLKKLLSDSSVLKLFQLALFDVAMLYQHFDILCENIYCTKIASRIARTYTRFHGLKNLCQDVLNVKLNKQQQSSDWAADELTEEQQKYAADDVLYLHRLREELDKMLERENRTVIAQACFDFIPHRCLLELQGWGAPDIFAHGFVLEE